MKALLKTAALAAALALGVGGSAGAATTTLTYVFGATPTGAPIVWSGNATTVRAGTQLTFSVLAGTGAIKLFDDGTQFYLNTSLKTTTAALVHTFLDKSTLFFLGYGKKDGMTVQMVLDAPDAAVPLPAALPLLAGALGLAGMMGRRRKAV